MFRQQSLTKYNGKQTEILNNLYTLKTKRYEDCDLWDDNERFEM